MVGKNSAGKPNWENRFYRLTVAAAIAAAPLIGYKLFHPDDTRAPISCTGNAMNDPKYSAPDNHDPHIFRTDGTPSFVTQKGDNLSDIVGRYVERGLGIEARPSLKRVVGYVAELNNIPDPAKLPDGMGLDLPAVCIYKR